jgi:hypothetical protein
MFRLLPTKCAWFLPKKYSNEEYLDLEFKCKNKKLMHVYLSVVHDVHVSKFGCSSWTWIPPINDLEKRYSHACVPIY